MKCYLKTSPQKYFLSSTCVIMPNPNFPNFSEVIVCFQVELVEASSLKSSLSLQMTRPALCDPVQADANMSCGAWWSIKCNYLC